MIFVTVPVTVQTMVVFEQLTVFNQLARRKFKAFSMNFTQFITDMEKSVNC